MSNAPFTIDPVRTAIALAYMNRELIADMVLPRVPVGMETFKWMLYDKADRFNIPDTTVDRKGKLNQVEFGGSEQTSQTNDYGLEDVIPRLDVNNAANTGFDPVGNAVEITMDLIMLQREWRTASIVHNAATYGASNKETLTGTDQWDNAASKPIDQISDAKEVPFMRPNVMVINGASLLALRRNDQILQAFHGNTGTEGMVPVAYLEELLELKILVGRARRNSANPGQTMVLSEIWSDNAALLYLNPNAAPNKGLTFGLTAQYESRIARTKIDDDVGLRGATVVQVGESVKELVMAADTAYYFNDTLA